MKTASSLFPLLTVVIAGAAAFIEPLGYRLAAFSIAAVPAIIAIRQRRAEGCAGNGIGKAQGMNEHARDRLQKELANHSEQLPRLAGQLKDVIQQTEQAALELNERFMNIAGRARQQLIAANEILAAQQAPAATAQRPERLSVVTAETATLSRDIQDIIVSLQFQDLTKQHIEKVIEQLQHMHREIEMMRLQLCEIEAADSRERQTTCA